jgi:hypothetical protein
MSTDYPSLGKRILCGVFALFLCTVCASAQFGRSRAASPIKTDNFTYNGQSYQVVVLNGQPMQVKLNNQILLMVNNGVVMGYPGLDANLIEGAKSALKAYEAANGIVPPGTPPATASAAPTPTASQSAAPNAASSLTVDGVISLIDAGISADLIIAKIQKSGQTFDLSTEDMVRLKKAGASEAVMKAMMSTTPAPVAVSGTPTAGSSGAGALSVNVAPNPVAENPNMGKLKKEGFVATIGHGVSNAATGKSVIDQLSMRNILPQWDPNKRLSEQYPHIAIVVLSAPMGWTDDYRVVLRKNSNVMRRCFNLKAVVWLDAARSKTSDEFEWCADRDMFMSQLQPTYLYSLAATKADYGQTTGVDRTEGPQPPDKLLPNDRATLDMEAKTNPEGASKDLNLDQNSLFAIMFANVRKDLGETLGSDGDYRVWITRIKKAAGPSLF